MEKSLGNEIHREQKKLKFRGLYQEIVDFMCELGLNDMSNYSLNEWKKEVGKKIAQKNYDDLMKKMKTYKKLDHEQLSKEDFEFKSYLNELKLSDARTRFKLRAKMVYKIKFNFQSDPLFTSENWKCSCQGSDSQIQS